MNFLFSSPIGRLPHLVRFVLSCGILALGFFIYNQVLESDPVPADTFYLAFTLSCLVILPGLFYYIRFTVLPRMESIGIPVGCGFIMLLPSLLQFLNLLVVSMGLPAETLLLPIFYPLGGCAALYVLALFFLPENSLRHGNIIQAILHDYEAGEGRILIRLVPLALTLLIVTVLYDLNIVNLPVVGPVGGIYHGLDDAQSMDNAQLARQIYRGQGYTTMFLRPYALTQLHDYSTSQGGGPDFFPTEIFPPGAPRTLPDTYNAPGYPYLLAAWFHIIHPTFDVLPAAMSQYPLFPADKWIPELNQIFMLLTALLVFGLGLRLFDHRVAWIALIAFLTSDMVWQYTITALSTSFLMFLVTAALFSILEIFCVGEACAEDETMSFDLAWAWALGLVLLLVAASLTRLHLLVLLMPVMVFLIRMPRANFLLIPLTLILVVAMVAPWFWHIYKICGNPLGSNLPLLLYGGMAYEGNQIYCTTTIPQYELLFKDAGLKEILGFRWHFERAWDLLGSNPLILLFGASILYSFKRPRAQAFLWLILGCAVSIIFANNLGVAQPQPISPWNTLVVLFPAMLVIGSAFFFILLDRLNLQAELINSLIVTAMLLITALPLSITVLSPSNKIVSYPPYLPGAIDYLGRLAQPDEWVTTDMPWATAWYSDRASLWLPDSLADFEHLHDNVCPTGLLFFTPVTLDSPVTNLTSGEYKDWFTFIVGAKPPPSFPLQTPLVRRATPEYIIWSDRQRWQ